MQDITITDDFVETFERLITEEMATIGVPGLALVIIKDDNIIYSSSFGGRDLASKLPVNHSI